MPEVVTHERAASFESPRTDRDILLGPSEFRELVSGRRGGPVAAILRGALGALEIPYTAAVRWRNRRFDTGRSASARVEVPVVSVGNITLGGTGKTPTVEWLARWFAAAGVRAGMLSRGYGARAGQPNDEALELAQKLPGVPHVLDRNRVRGARRAIDEFGCRVLLLDDGFQHRWLARDLDIVLIDATEPFGFGHVFPRGTLREPLTGLARAQVVMLSRVDLVDESERARICGELDRLAPAAIRVETRYAPQALVSAAGQRRDLAELAGKQVAAFCGIGNPDGFCAALARSGYRVAALRELADHVAYPGAQIDALAAWSASLDVAAVVCTCKDLVKIGDRWHGDKPLWALESRLQITAGQQELEAALRRVIAGAKRA